MRLNICIRVSRHTDSGDSSDASAWAGVGRKTRPAARAAIGIEALYDRSVKIHGSRESGHTGDMKRRAAIECEVDEQLLIATIVVDVPGLSESQDIRKLP